MVVSVSMSVLLLSGCGDKVSSEVEMVQEGTMDICPNAKLGAMIDNYFQSPSWESIIEEDGNKYVNVNGDIYFEGREARGLVQFKIDQKSNSFQYNAFEIDGEAQNNATATVLFKDMCNEQAHDTNDNTSENNVAYSKPPVKIRVEQAYNEAYHYYYPKIIITSVVDNTIVNDVKINKGNCNYDNSDIVYQNGGMKAIKLLPRTLGYGEEVEIRLKKCNVLKIDVTTDKGEWTVEY